MIIKRHSKPSTSISFIPNTVLGSGDTSLDKKDKNICLKKSHRLLPEIQRKRINRMMLSTMGKNKIGLRECRE